MKRIMRYCVETCLTKEQSAIIADEKVVFLA